MFLFLILPLAIIAILIIFILRARLGELDFSYSKLLGEDCIIALVRELAKRGDTKTPARPRFRQLVKYHRVLIKLQAKDAAFKVVLKENRDLFLRNYKSLQKKLRLKNREFFLQMSRPYRLCNIIVGGYQGNVSKESIQKAVSELNAISPLDFNEITALPYALALTLLEFFCVHIYHAKKIEASKKIAREDVIKQRINISHLNDKIYLYYFLRLADTELKNTITRVCEINDIDIKNESQKFEDNLTNYHSSVVWVTDTMIKKEKWFSEKFLLGLSELDKMCILNDLSDQEKIEYYNKIAKKAKKSRLTELAFARNEIEFSKLNLNSAIIPIKQRTPAFEAAADAAMAIPKAELSFAQKQNKKTCLSLPAIKKEAVSKEKIKQIQQKMSMLPIMQIEFFDSQKKGIGTLNNFIKNAQYKILLDDGKEDHRSLLYIDKNRLKDKIMDSCNCIKDVIALSEYVLYTKDDNILNKNNLFQRAAKILLEASQRNCSFQKSETTANYKRNKSTQKNNNSNDRLSPETEKSLTYYAMNNFLLLIKDEDLRKIFIRIRGNLRREINSFLICDINTVSLAALSDAVDDTKARVLLKKEGERILGGADAAPQSFVLYIAALLKKGYMDLAFTLLKIFFNKYSDLSYLAYNCMIENFLGLTIKGSAIHFFPKLPKEIAFVKIKLKNDDDEFYIEIDNAEYKKSKWEMYVGSIRYDANSLRLTNSICDKKITLKKI